MNLQKQDWAQIWFPLPSTPHPFFKSLTAHIAKQQYMSESEKWNITPA